MITYIEWEEENECFASLEDITYISVGELEDGSLRMGFEDRDSTVVATIGSYEDAEYLGYLLANYAPRGFSGDPVYTEVYTSRDFDLDPDEIGALVADVIVGRSDDDIRNFADYLDDSYLSRL